MKGKVLFDRTCLFICKVVKRVEPHADTVQGCSRTAHGPAGTSRTVPPPQQNPLIYCTFIFIKRDNATRFSTSVLGQIRNFIFVFKGTALQDF